jgi:hypothetical protein
MGKSVTNYNILSQHMQIRRLNVRIAIEICRSFHLLRVDKCIYGERDTISRGKILLFLVLEPKRKNTTLKTVLPTMFNPLYCSTWKAISIEPFASAKIYQTRVHSLCPKSILSSADLLNLSRRIMPNWFILCESGHSNLVSILIDVSFICPTTTYHVPFYSDDFLVISCACSPCQHNS